MRKVISVLLFLLLLCTGLNAQQFKRGLLPSPDVDKKVMSKPRLSRGDYDNLPSSHSVKKFAPVPESQGEFGTCTAWAVAYNARTISYALKNQFTTSTQIGSNTFSPGFVYRMIEPRNTDCEGSSIEDALRLVKSDGVPKYSDFPMNCVNSVPSYLQSMANDYKIDNYSLLFNGWRERDRETMINFTKKSISQNHPVPFGMHCPNSFNSAKDRWTPTTNDYIDARNVFNGNTGSYSGHAMCIVGYDDKKYGGAFEIMNSWGTDWGNKGFTWITYDDYFKFASHAFEMVDYPGKKPGPKPVVDPVVDPVVVEKFDLNGTLEFINHEKKTVMPFKRANLDTRGIEIGEEDDEDEEVDYVMYELDGRFPAGFKFRVKFSNTQPAYVYAIGSDLLNNVTRLFPSSNMVSARLDYTYNNVVLPGDNKFYKLDNNEGGQSFFEIADGGSDFYCLLYSTEELDLDEIIASLKADGTNSTFSQKIKKVLGDNLVDFDDIRFKNNKIGFEANSNGRSVVALIVKFNREASWKK